MTPNVIFGVEDLYVDLDDEAFAMHNAAGTIAQAVNVEAEFDIVRAGFTVKLDRVRGRVAAEDNGRALPTIGRVNSVSP